MSEPAPKSLTVQDTSLPKKKIGTYVVIGIAGLLILLVPLWIYLGCGNSFDCGSKNSPGEDSSVVVDEDWWTNDDDGNNYNYDDTSTDACLAAENKVDSCHNDIPSGSDCCDYYSCPDEECSYCERQTSGGLCQRQNYNSVTGKATLCSEGQERDRNMCDS